MASWNKNLFLFHDAIFFDRIFVMNGFLFEYCLILSCNSFCNEIRFCKGGGSRSGREGSRL